MATLTQLITRVERRLSQVAGASVQIYSEDLIADMIQHKFDVLFDEAYWPQFTTLSETMTLDGSTGVVTIDLSSKIKKFDDIGVIFPDGSNTAISEVPFLTQNMSLITGSTPTSYGPNTNSNKVFNIFPFTATGKIQVTYRTKPDDFDSGDNVDFDSQALVLGAVYDYLEDDGTNPAATDKAQSLFESRVQQLRNLRSSAPIALDQVSLLPQSFSFTELT
tara:strand:- start:4633 stop:5292 length:660 start_codon:yes stop_codon:yes gene_type:complete